MSKVKRSGDKLKLAPFVAMTWEILNSEAYIKLTPSAGKALPYFRGKGMKIVFSRNAEESNAEFVFSYDEAERLGFAPATYSRIIGELVEKGFVDQAGYGGLRGFCKSYSKFSLSNRWRQYGKPDFEKVSRYPSEPR